MASEFVRNFMYDDKYDKHPDGTDTPTSYDITGIVNAKIQT